MTNRLELSFSADSQKFKLVKVSNPYLPVASYKSVPLAPEATSIIFADLAWSDFKWGADSLTVRDNQYQIVNMQFYPRSKNEAAPQ